jgi:ubiquinone/menaquinone biosynthesis C-methylase UbiE
VSRSPWAIVAAVLVTLAVVAWRVRHHGKQNAILEGAGPMKSFSHRHGGSHGGDTAPETRGRLLDQGWRYDLEAWFADTFVLGGALRNLRQRVVALAELGDGQAVLDVGCGTGTLAIAAAALVGAAGRVAGIDPAPRQIARARSKARRAGVSVDFRMGVIEALPFSEGSFDVVTSTLVMHHLPEDLKRQGLAEMARVLKPGGRLVLADFTRSQGHDDTSAHPGAGETGIQDQPELMRGAGFTGVEGEEVRFARGTHMGWAGAVVMLAKRP